jgi:hypothetical protein
MNLWEQCQRAASSVPHSIPSSCERASRAGSTAKVAGVRARERTQQYLRWVVQRGKAVHARRWPERQFPSKGFRASVVDASSASEDGLVKKRPTEATILAAYGQLMLQLQLLEMNFWVMRTANLTRGMSEAQVLEAIKKWDHTTFGDLVRGLKGQGHFDEDLRWKLDQLVELRNHVAHNFLREFFVAEHRPANYRRGLESIHRWQLLVEELNHDLERYVDGAFGDGWDQLSDAEAAEIANLQPKRWPLVDSDNASDEG